MKLSFRLVAIALSVTAAAGADSLAGTPLAGTVNTAEKTNERDGERKLDMTFTKPPSPPPTPLPTPIPTSSPTENPTASPSATPTTSAPTKNPSSGPTPAPTGSPTSSPSATPTTSAPTQNPSSSPTAVPTGSPTSSPSATPTTSAPTKNPSSGPTPAPTGSPTSSPSVTPTTSAPTQNPSSNPTADPSGSPTSSPSATPTTSAPTKNPSSGPTPAPTGSPTSSPSVTPTTSAPTQNPSSNPTANPSGSPTSSPSATPTTSAPSDDPSSSPSRSPTNHPTGGPTASPSSDPSSSPTKSPAPSSVPTDFPTQDPTASPSNTPTKAPTDHPTAFPTSSPSSDPSSSPTKSPAPSSVPTDFPSQNPTASPSSTPTKAPTDHPTTFPTTSPSSNPSEFPTVSPAPSSVPTDSPTNSPTNKPTPGPTPPPTPVPTSNPTHGPPPKCGEILNGEGELLGPFEKPTDDMKPSDFAQCNAGEGDWFAKSYYAPSYAYSFRLTKKCEYQYRKPATDNQYVTLAGGVNAWFDAAAITFRRPDNVGYKVTEDVEFTGYEVPDWETDLIESNIEGCPEDFCVKVVGKAVGYTNDHVVIPEALFDRSLQKGLEVPELVYAFSHREAYYDFLNMLKDSMKSSNSEHIFLTNHFMKCGCESFCYDNSKDEDPQATCYTEEVCGETIYKIVYKGDYPEDLKPEWADTGTTEVMEWFSACAHAQYGCFFMEEISAALSTFKGTGEDGQSIPMVYKYEFYLQYKHIYAFGGKEQHGFPHSKKMVPHIGWSCPSRGARNELEHFVSLIEEAEFMRESGLDLTVPELPCEPDTIDPPLDPEIPPPVDCEEINHSGFCMQLPGGICYIREPIENCIDVDFVLQESDKSVKVYSDVEEWLKVCLEIGTDCELYIDTSGSAGHLTNAGLPATSVGNEGSGWHFEISNQNRDGQNTLRGNPWLYDCESWEGAYGAKNFTDGAGARFEVFENTYGDLFTIEDITCTPEPTESPSESPSLSFEPTNYPTLAPTVCGESYLDSDTLNIALVIDLSRSTYEKEFSSTTDIGDYNGDGKGNTILDAQGMAIEDLLVSISESETLNNMNSEIGLITFDTDAQFHGVWKPLNDEGARAVGDSPNQELIDYIKTELRADHDVYNTNNGYTNFDAALDRSVQYFQEEATAKRLNLLVFLSDGEPNVRGDGDEELYCANTTRFWNADDPTEVLQCSDLNLTAGVAHDFCRENDSDCVSSHPYQDCVRGPNQCMNADAVTQYESEIDALTGLKVERLAIGVGDESNVEMGSALWMIDNNPAKDLGVLPIQALNLEELSSALKNLCILNTDPPTGTPSSSPSDSPTTSPAPSANPTVEASLNPTDLASQPPTVSHAPSGFPEFEISTNQPTGTPTQPPVGGADTPSPTGDPTKSPAPTFLLPDCYEGPKLVKKDSSDLTMCHYDQDMVQINDMDTEAVTIAINNVWTQDALPSQMRVFIHTDGIDAISKGGGGFQCLDEGGNDIDIEGDNQFTVQCYQTGPEEPFLAVIDVVITDDHICGTNDVPHPCYPDGDPILESCSWRIVVPCDYDEMCTEAPTAASSELPSDGPSLAPSLTPTASPTTTPTSSHSYLPTDGPSLTPSLTPTSSPTATPTASHSYLPTDGPSLTPSLIPTTSPTATPTASHSYLPSDGPSLMPSDGPSMTPSLLEALTQPPIITNGGDDDDNVPTFLPPIGNECPEDIILIDHQGVTEYVEDSVVILSQDTTSVTVALQQLYTSPSENIDYVFYNYHTDLFNMKCYEEENVPGNNRIEITIECSRNSQIALLEYWVADDLRKGVLKDGDNAVIPECCHPDVPVETPVTKYYIEIKCVTLCPEEFE